MAFFKFPWSAKSAPAPAAKKTAKGAAAARSESVEVMRRRARHRLMGAALLVVAAVVGFPMLFDSQPRSIPVDARIEIPDRDTVAPLVVPAPASVAGTEEFLEPTATKPKGTATEPAAAPTRAEAVASAPPAKESAKELAKERSAPAPAFVEARPSAARGKPDPAPAVAAPADPVLSASEQAARKRDSERARALLEGRSGKVAAQAPSIPVAAADVDRFIVQVGAFSDDSKVRDARAKLERGGLTTYTQAVQTKDGKRTRVRVGPFTGRAEAEQAAAKIKALGLPAAVLSL